MQERHRRLSGALLAATIAACGGGGSAEPDASGADSSAESQNPEGGGGAMPDGPIDVANSDGASAADDSSDALPSMVQGTFNGMALDVQSVLAGTGQAPASGSVFSGSVLTLIALVNVPDYCSMQGHASRKGFESLTLGVVTNSALTPGVYTTLPPVADAGAGSGRTGSGATFNAYDQNCDEVGYESTASSTVTVTSVTATEIVGSFDITLNIFDPTTGMPTGAGDHVTGSFAAPICAAYSAEISVPPDGGGSSTCS
jgi:hypothetical protein